MEFFSGIYYKLSATHCALSITTNSVLGNFLALHFIRVVGSGKEEWLLGQCVKWKNLKLSSAFLEQPESDRGEPTNTSLFASR